MKQMIFRLTCLIVTIVYSLESFGTEPPLTGFSYKVEKQPSGKEWESPENLALNKEQPRAWFFSFQDEESARKVLPENSSYWQSLNGNWKFHWAPNPDSRPKEFYLPTFDVSQWDEIPVPSNWNIYGIQKDGSLKYGVPIYVNQPVIFMHQVKVDDWREGVMRTPPTHWTTYQHRNEVGSFRREFEIPTNWKKREVFIHFDGVDSFFYLWINGEYVGFSKNSRNTARFNITPYLQEGKNTLAVEVYRSSDGSFLEAQDMFRLPGIFRTVALHAVPQIHIQDLTVTPDLDENYQNGSLAISAKIRNLSKKTAKGYKIEYKLYANSLYSDDNYAVDHDKTTAPIPTLQSKQSNQAEQAILSLINPQKWSAEHPYRYTLVAKLKDTKERVIETVSTIVGFREVEIKNTPASQDEFGLAGRYYYINGKPVKLKGVNRHETNPAVGHAITREMMEKEIMLMKRANINHVRNAHYPDDPYWYFLCNKYGIYLEDEANIESHQYYYGAASLSHPKEWEAAHVARVMEMAHSHINHPSIVIWSLGNEAGPGKNFETAYQVLKKFDLSRPIQYERNNAIVDMGSNQYPSIAWVREAVKGKYNIKYPFHISEYAHSMGNAVGNLIDYWEAIESTNFFCGGAIWDWVDQSMYNYDPQTGERYLAYGGDFGDTPNDGQFVMNGIVFGDLTPKPQYYEVKKVYQHIGIKGIDIPQGRFEIFNKYYFKDLSDYTPRWSLYENGKEIEHGTLEIGNIAPRTRKQITIPYNYSRLKTDHEYFVKIQFLLKKEQPWAAENYPMAEEQILVKIATEVPSINTIACEDELTTAKPLNPHFRPIIGKNFQVIFDDQQGTIHQLTYQGKTIIESGNGPRLNAFRAFVNNDNWFYSSWFENGLHNLQHKVIAHQTFYRKNGTIVLFYTIESQAPNAANILGGTSSGKNQIEELTDQPFGPKDFKFITNQLWTVYPDGSIELQSSITSNNPTLILPRLGYTMQIHKQFPLFTYYGRGPIGNYADRKTGQFIEQYQTTVTEEFVSFPKPQEMANHEEVRWCALTNKSDEGIVFIATNQMAVSALPYSAMELILASHPHQLPNSKATHLRLDVAVTGLGGNSCGQGGPLEKDRILANQHNFGFIIRPAGKDLAHIAHVSAAGEMPLSIMRDNTGKLFIQSANKNATILYSINQSKEKKYETPILFRNGGKVTAWFKENPEMKTTFSFEKIEQIPTTVIYASSQESGEGNATHLTDGDPNTIWHTMYSVTVAKYPHWVDLDAGEEKLFKGFTYLPRQNGPNGNIKTYTIQVSQDGKDWGKPIHQGTFENNQKLKKVTFTQPVKARYLRFTALSEQSGQDFASGAEITVLAE